MHNNIHTLCPDTLVAKCRVVLDLLPVLPSKFGQFGLELLAGLDCRGHRHGLHLLGLLGVAGFTGSGVETPANANAPASAVAHVRFRSADIR